MFKVRIGSHAFSHPDYTLLNIRSFRTSAAEYFAFADLDSQTARLVKTTDLRRAVRRSYIKGMKSEQIGINGLTEDGSMRP